MAKVAVGWLAYGAASLALTVGVAVAARELEQPPAPVWSVVETTPDTGEQDPWCKVLNGRTICVGEQN